MEQRCHCFSPHSTQSAKNVTEFLPRGGPHFGKPFGRTENVDHGSGCLLEAPLLETVPCYRLDKLPGDQVRVRFCVPSRDDNLAQHFCGNRFGKCSEFGLPRPDNLRFTTENSLCNSSPGRTGETESNSVSLQSHHSSCHDVRSSRSTGNLPDAGCGWFRLMARRTVLCDSRETQ